ncbi:unnamed protein product [Psylliodes chrysocephalus]|uniref:Phosphatidylinositol N-acetylglucosaminyltransferase subunit H conserved domain-containing protein n=1 Tax=Psylliodes chrysocephalus TaxID=3402493 RepID=A0A9P0CJF1_9CUCU|nr:unnamed protein product [Psylliodes chrysocephala]
MAPVDVKPKYLNFRNINGNEVRLYINEAPSCLQVTIFSCQKNLYQKCICLFITAILNSVLLLYNIVTINVILGILIIILLLLYTVCVTTVEENLVIIKDFGIEISKRNVISTKKVFYPQEQVKRVFINEVIFRRKVLFVMTLLLNDLENDKLVPLFVDTLPQLELLKVTYSHIKHQFHSKIG